jgi:large subunit ribosomal protein L9
MELILNERIANLGHLGDKVNVKNGFARNFLIPKGMAVRATTKNLADFEVRRAELEKSAKAKLDAATAQADKVKDVEIVIAAKASDEGKLFGSIGTRDLAERISTASGIEVAKNALRMPEGVIRQLGEYEIGVHFHTDVDVVLKVVVNAE